MSRPAPSAGCGTLTVPATARTSRPRSAMPSLTPLDAALTQPRPPGIGGRGRRPPPCIVRPPPPTVVHRSARLPLAVHPARTLSRTRAHDGPEAHQVEARWQDIHHDNYLARRDHHVPLLG